MPLGRRKETGKRQRKSRGARRDPFAHLHDERERAESGEPWFQAADDGAPDLDLQAGISSNLTEEDLLDDEDQ